MDRAVKHYSSLFKLPQYKTMLLLLAVICISGGFLSTLIVFPTAEGLMNGLLLGFSLFLINLLIDYFLHMSVLRQDPVYDIRRVIGLSLFSWALWFLFIFIGVAVAILAGLSWWIKLSLFGFLAVSILRLVVLFSTSTTSYTRTTLASFSHPLACVIPFIMFWTRIEYPVTSIILILLFALAIGFVSSWLFVSILNRVEAQTIGVPSLSIFKAFLLNWIVDLTAPFEEILEQLGESQDIEAYMIKFDSSKPKAAIIVSSIHPGPFKNIGSSLLPSMLKESLESKLGCDVCVPHGLLGHEYDLASQIQNQKIISKIAELANFATFEAKATPFITVSNGLATACCQIFGDFAFLSFTLAPNTTEDMPQELGLYARNEAQKRGLNCCVTVNAHNSINGIENIGETLGALKRVATTALEKAVSLERSSFGVGAATIIPEEFSLKEGMGPGGITVIVVKVEEQKTAYIIIDGNNMISGLREKIFSAVRSIGIDECEVFTTDTHSVNAIILNTRGYHPVGEAINHDKLISHIKEATLSALSNLEKVTTACQSTTIHGVKVIGEKKLGTLCLLIDRTLQKVKTYGPPIFALSGLLFMLVLTFL